jgi:zinc transport system ATP-binding protein
VLVTHATAQPTAERTPVLELRDVSVGYEDQAAVKGVNLAIVPGDVVALIGPNGSGKSTLVRGILGLAQVLDGEVRLFGDPDPGAGEHRRIGYVPQRHTVGGAIPSTVEEVVGSGRLVHRRWYQRASAGDRAAVAEAIEAVGLADRSRAMVSTLSGGQQRRVLIARALAGRPDMLIMDEPTAGVDAESQETLVRTLHSLVARGLTLLIVTHEIAPLRPMLTRAVAMSGGRVVRDTPLTPGDPRSELPIRESEPDPGHTHGIETGYDGSVFATDFGPAARRGEEA